MDAAWPVHVVSTRQEVRDRIAAVLASHGVASHDSVKAFRSSLGEEPVIVVLDPEGGVSWAESVALCRAVCDQEVRAVPFILEEGDRGAELHPLSVGPSIRLDGADDALDPEGKEWPPFELHQILAFIARIRHDINNPLTAGMAENQLLLMDLGEEGEVGESLTTIHRQLGRIQGLVQELGRVRRPRPREE